MEKKSSLVKTIKLWNEEETNALLDKYNEYISEIGPTRRFKNKKEMWAAISEDIETKTSKQCEERWKTILKRKKHRVESVKQKVKVKLKKRRLQVKTVQPEVEEDDDDEDDDDMISNELEELTKSYSLNRVLLKIAQRSERAKERRHKEKMASLNKFADLLKKLIDK